jgi:hypothetical protein
MSKTKIEGDYRQFMDKTYIGEWDLPESEDLTVEIDHAEVNEVKNERGTQEKLCLHLRGGYKPLILNATNGANVSEALGTKDVAKWQGKKIILYREKVSAFGKTTMAVRVRTYAPKEEIFCEECGGGIRAAHGKSPRQLAAYTKEKYGKELCAACATKAAQKKEEQEAISENDED